MLILDLVAILDFFLFSQVILSRQSVIENVSQKIIWKRITLKKLKALLQTDSRTLNDSTIWTILWIVQWFFKFCNEFVSALRIIKNISA